MLTVATHSRAALAAFAARCNARIAEVAADQPIPGSFWGEPEAGIIGTTVYVQGQTPVHSLLHELAHVLMHPPAMRALLHTDAGGDDSTEESVCALQLTLASAVPGYSSLHCLADMDTWGYSFRQGEARRWWLQDGPQARQRWPLHVRRLVEALTPQDSGPATR